MSIVDTARADARRIVSDSVRGAGRPARFESPLGVVTEVAGIFSRITDVERFESVAVTGAVATLCVSVDDFPNGAPTKVTDPARLPWRVHVEGHTYSVVDTRPDDMSGLTTCFLREWRCQ